MIISNFKVCLPFSVNCLDFEHGQRATNLKSRYYSIDNLVRKFAVESTFVCNVYDISFLLFRFGRVYIFFFFFFLFLLKSLSKAFLTGRDNFVANSK